MHAGIGLSRLLVACEASHAPEYRTEAQVGSERTAAEKSRSPLAIMCSVSCIQPRKVALVCSPTNTPLSAIRVGLKSMELDPV